jgi:hypothetical protein
MARSGGTLTAFQREWCTHITKKLIDCPLSLFFREPVDPDQENLVDYRAKIERPMDLGTIQQQLAANKFSSVDEWKADVRLVWKNAIKYNGMETFIGIFAQELSNVFERYLKEMPENEWALWTNRVRKTQQKLHQYLQMHTLQSVTSHKS